MGRFTDDLPETSSGFLKMAIGDNEMRVMTDGAVLGEHYKKGICIGKEKGCPACAEGLKPTYRKLFRVIDRKDDELKLVKFGSKILKGLDAMSESRHYAFSSFPMPYDINIAKTKTGSEDKDVEYHVMALPPSPITREQLEEVQKLESPLSVVDAMKKKQLRSVNPNADLRSDDSGEVEKNYEIPEERDSVGGEIPF